MVTNLLSKHIFLSIQPASFFFFFKCATSSLHTHFAPQHLFSLLTCVIFFEFLSPVFYLYDLVMIFSNSNIFLLLFILSSFYRVPTSHFVVHTFNVPVFPSFHFPHLFLPLCLILLFYLSDMSADERLLGVNKRSVPSCSTVITSTSASAATTAQSLSLVS